MCLVIQDKIMLFSNFGLMARNNMVALIFGNMNNRQAELFKVFSQYRKENTNTRKALVYVNGFSVASCSPVYEKSFGPCERFLCPSCSHVAVHLLQSPN